MFEGRRSTGPGQGPFEANVSQGRLLFHRVDKRKQTGPELFDSRRRGICRSRHSHGNLSALPVAKLFGWWHNPLDSQQSTGIHNAIASGKVRSCHCVWADDLNSNYFFVVNQDLAYSIVTWVDRLIVPLSTWMVITRTYDNIHSDAIRILFDLNFSFFFSKANLQGCPIGSQIQKSLQ